MAGTRSHISRRALLVAGGGAVTAAAGGVLLHEVLDDDEPSGRPPADPKDRAGSVGPFDIGAARELLAPSELHHVSGPQSIAFGADPDVVVAAQVVPKGVRLRDEKKALGGRDRRLAGDLCVTLLSRSGDERGFMHLRGFGHGISFGVESVTGGAYLWVESDVDPETGYGRAVARVPYRAGSVLDSSSAQVEHHRPLSGSHTIHPAVDQRARRVLLSHWTGGDHHYAVHGMDDFLAGRYEPLYRVEDAGRRDGETLQGCALYGDHIYQLTGHPYTDAAGGNPPSGGGDTYVSAFEVRSGKLVGRRKVRVAPGLNFREPEGIAVRPGQRPELAVAFSVKRPGLRALTVYGCPS